MLDRLNQDIKEAMKAKQKEKLQALRYLKSMLMENQTAKKQIPELDVVIKHHKKLKDSLENFPEGNPLRQQTILEIGFLEPYLPAQLSEDDVRKMISEFISENPDAQFGLIMKEISGKIKGQFDGKRASELVKEIKSAG